MATESAEIFTGGKFFTEADVEETFTKGSGNGGQKVNKSVNAVILKHIPTGLMVKCHQERSLYFNRKIARRLLDAQLDVQINGKDSKAEKKRAKLRKQKDRRRRRTAAASASGSGASEAGSTEAQQDEADLGDESVEEDDDDGDDYANEKGQHVS
jgi:protein subunit release factor B